MKEESVMTVKDIIKISKLDESNELFEEKEVDIFNLCQDIRKRLEKQAEDKNIEISITGESVIIKTVDHIVDEIIYNLIDDGYNYTILDCNYEKVARNKNSKNSQEVLIYNYNV